MDPIIGYLKLRTLPIDSSTMHKVKCLTLHYTLVDGQLYKRSFSSPLLKCLLPSEADYALREVHEGIYGNHLGRQALAYRILHQGYYWPTKQKDAIDYVRACDSC